MVRGSESSSGGQSHIAGRLKSRARVVYWNNIPSPYVVQRFNAIAARDNISFKAVFTERREADRSWTVDETTWDFDAAYVGEGGPSGRDLREADLLVSLYENMSYVRGCIHAKRHGCRVALRVLPTNSAWRARRNSAELAKHVIFRLVDAAKVPGPEGQTYAGKYGLPPDRCFHVTQSPAAPTLAHVEHPLAPDVVRFLYVGRIWRGKGLDHLFAAYANASAALARAGMKSSLQLVGDGLDEDHYRAFAGSLTDVHFTGFREGANLARAYASASAFVFPTLGDPHGLVIDEAMTFGLPVLCSSAAGDATRRMAISGGGIVYPAGDAEALASCMLRIGLTPTLRRVMSKAGRDYAARLTHDKYAADFEEFTSKVLALPPRVG